MVTLQEMIDGRLQALAQRGNQKLPQIVQHYHYLEEVLKDLRRFQTLPYGEAEYREFEKIPGNIRCGIYDKRIAATALARKLTLVTANMRHFQDIPNLILEDWTARPLE